MMPESKPEAAAVESAIRERQTFKVLGDPQLPICFSNDELARLDKMVWGAMKTSGWAPFHYDRGQDGLVEPWRVDWMSQDVCRKVARRMSDWFDNLKPNNKLTAMLAACGSLALVSWLPQFDPGAADELRESQRQTDEEHLAATAAYVQNLLLLLTAHGFGTYWSSGGQFRDLQMFEKLQLPHRGRLLAAVFIDYSPLAKGGPPELQRLPGKLRNRRCPDYRWLNTVDLVLE